MDSNGHQDAKYDWLRALAQPVTYLGVAMILSIIATASYLIVKDRQHTLEVAIRQGESLTRLFEQFASRSFKSADNTILLLRRSYQHDPANTSLVDWASDPELKNDLTFQFSIIGSDGYIKTSSFGQQAAHIDLSDRKHFRVHVNSKEDRLYISEPLTLRTAGVSSIVLSRRLVNDDGSFAGVLAAPFDVSQLEKFYRAIDLGKDGIVSLVGRDGIIRAAGANGVSRPDIIGLNFRNAHVFKALEQAPAGTFWNGPSQSAEAQRIDDVKRLVAYRLIEGFPLIAMVGISEDVVFEHARGNARIYLGISGTLTTGILIAIVVATIRQRKLISASREITRQAFHDGLTDLANRTLFRREVDCALARLQATGERFNVLMLDLDNFKSINDSLGHAAGDDLIRLVAARLEASVRGEDVIARLGGDEFAILQRAGGDCRDAAIILANRLIEAIGEPYDLGGHQAIVETSIGIALAGNDDAKAGTDTDHLLKCADLALYQAKSAGRNTFRLFEPSMEEAARSRYQLEVDLRGAIARDEFEVHYQPLVNADERGICGVEALVRWHHPQQGLVMPETFIPVAESTGLIVQIGELVLRRACMDAVNWPAHVKVAVNLSPVQFRKGDIVGLVSSALLQSGLAPERLELEITESVLLQDDEINLAKLHELQSLGLSIVLDDFGTGYSSLSYLQTFPFDKIKIDRSFVAGVGERSDCAAIVCAVVGLAKSLNVTTTAEGVETAEQFDLLRVAGCDQAQGYLFGCPGPASQMRFELKPERRMEMAVA